MGFCFADSTRPSVKSNGWHSDMPEIQLPSPQSTDLVNHPTSTTNPHPNAEPLANSFSDSSAPRLDPPTQAVLRPDPTSGYGSNMCKLGT